MPWQVLFCVTQTGVLFPSVLNLKSAVGAELNLSNLLMLKL